MRARRGRVSTRPAGASRHPAAHAKMQRHIHACMHARTHAPRRQLRITGAVRGERLSPARTFPSGRGPCSQESTAIWLLGYTTQVCWQEYTVAARLCVLVRVVILRFHVRRHGGRATATAARLAQLAKSRNDAFSIDIILVIQAKNLSNTWNELTRSRRGGRLTCISARADVLTGGR